jgi:hypothetical protein
MELLDIRDISSSWGIEVKDFKDGDYTVYKRD